MKMRAFFATVLGVLMLASCSKNDGGTTVDPVPTNISKAYMSLSLQFPQGTKASSTETGSQEESAVNSVWVAAFDDALNKVDFKDVTSFIKDAPGNTSGSNSAFSISEETKQIFVVINPSEALRDQIHDAVDYAAMNKALVATAVDVATDNQFLMVSAGSIDDVSDADDKGLTEVSLSVAVDDSDGAREDAKNEALKSENLVKVNVDRVAAKIKVVVNSPTIENGTGEITGWVLNTTNKSFFPYAPLVSYSGNAVYREDPNYGDLTMDEDGTGDAVDAFNWIHNPASTISDGSPIAWKQASDADAAEYCLENTMDVDAQNYNNSTKIIFKAKFTPDGAGITGEGWFKLNGKYASLNDVFDYYAELNSDYDNKKPLLGVWDELLTKALGLNNKGWTGGTRVSLSDLNGVQDVAYKVSAYAKAHDLDVQYYPNSECYYSVTIKHDDGVQKGQLGRWGLVRNNAYTIQVNKLSGAGTSYIPDPTDPDIGPDNPDPENPEDNDGESLAYIAVSITINPWTTWSQTVEL